MASLERKPPNISHILHPPDDADIKFIDEDDGIEEIVNPLKDTETLSGSKISIEMLNDLSASLTTLNKNDSFNQCRKSIDFIVGLSRETSFDSHTNLIESYEEYVSKIYLYSQYISDFQSTPSKSMKFFIDQSNDERTPDEILKEFDEIEHSFTEEFLEPNNILKSDSDTGVQVIQPLTITTSAPMSGLSVLESLLTSMEQISRLKADNENLRSMCKSLEQAKSLLEVQNDLLVCSREHHQTGGGGIKDIQNVLSKAQSKVMHYLGSPSGDSKSSQQHHFNRIASDNSSIAKRDKPTVHRSLSVGSIDNVVDMDLVPMSPPDNAVKLRNRNNRSSSPSKKHKRFSKWQRVKKVFSGKVEGGVSEGGSIDAEQLVRVNSKIGVQKQKSKPPHLIRITSSESKIQKQLSEPHEGQQEHWLKQQTTLQEPPSPSSVQSEPPSSIPQAPGEEEEGEVPMILPGTHLQSSTSSTEVGTPLFQRSRGERRIHGSSGSLSDNEARPPTRESILKRRRSSPTLHSRSRLDLNEEDTRNNNFRGEHTPGERISQNISSEEYSMLHDDEIIRRKFEDAKKSIRSPWGRVKNIIHTRKDSLKRNSRRISGGDVSTDADGETSPPNSTWDLKSADYDKDRGKVVGESLSDSAKLVRRFTTHPCRSPSDSPRVVRRRRAGSVKGTPDSPALGKRASYTAPSTLTTATTAPNMSDITALFGVVSDDFHKKMHEWEQKKLKSKDNTAGATGASSSDASFSEDFIRKMEEWERKKEHDVQLRKKQQQQDVAGSPPEGHLTVEQTRLSQSFSRTVQEWEKIKEKRTKECSSPIQSESRKVLTRSRTDTRSKSSDRGVERERDKSKHRYEKELQKIEKKEHKIEKEKEKLELMKMRLDIAVESGSGTEVKTDIITEDFLKKLHQWEMIKVQQPTAESPGPHSRSRSGRLSRKSIDVGSSRESRLLPEPPSAEKSKTEQEILSDQVDMAAGLIASLKEANRKLEKEKEELSEDIVIIQYEYDQITDRINAMNQEHYAEIDRYRRQLDIATTIGKPKERDSHLLMESMTQLKRMFTSLNQQLQTTSVEKTIIQSQIAEIMKHRIDAEEKLYTEMQNMYLAILGSKKTRPSSPNINCSDAVLNLFAHLRNYVKKANDFQTLVVERQKIIEDMQRHLLVQEVTNRLLVTDLERKQNHIWKLEAKHRDGTIKRRKTFHGHDCCEVQDDNIRNSLAALKQEQTPLIAESYKEMKLTLGELSHGLVDTLVPHAEWLDNIHTQLQQKLALQHQDEQSQTVSASLMSRSMQTLCHSTHSDNKQVQTTPDVTAVATGTTQTVLVNPDVSDVAIQVITLSDFDSNYNTDLRNVSTTIEYPESGADITESVCSSNIVPMKSVDRPSSADSRNSDLTVQPSSPQLFHSPIIRSRHPRKLKGEAKNKNSVEGRTWKATPPRRILRNRRTSHERREKCKSESSSESAFSDRKSIGERTVSDSSVYHTANDSSASSSARNSYGDESVGKPASTLFDIPQNIDPSAIKPSSPVTRARDLSRDDNYRKAVSPTRLKGTPVASVHGLKTARELMIESEKRRLSISHERNLQTRSADGSLECISVETNTPETVRLFEKKPLSTTYSSSSDKENVHKSGCVSKSSASLGTSISDSPSLTEIQFESKPALKDVTNGSSQEGHVNIAFESRSVGGDSVGSSPGVHHTRSRLSDVQFRIRRGKSEPRSSCPDDIWKRTSSPTLEHDRQSVVSSGSYTGGGHRSRKQMFFRKRARSQAPKGAVKQLCRQAINLSIDQDLQTPEGGAQKGDSAPVPGTSRTLPSSLPSTDSSQKHRTSKLLDSSWIQKSKKLFKVSK